MRSLSKFLVGVLLILHTVPAFDATGLTGYRDIWYVRIGNGHIRVYGSTNWTDPSSCSGSPTNQSVIVLDTDPSYKEIVAAVLAAEMGNREVQFWVSGCTTDSGSQYPKGTFIYLK